MHGEASGIATDQLHTAIQSCTGKYALCLLNANGALPDFEHRAATVLRPGDHLIALEHGRLALVLDNLIDVNHAHLAGIKLQRTFDDDQPGANHGPRVSCGFAYAGRLHPQGDTVGELCARAEAALASATQRRQCFEVFTLEDADTVENHWQVNLRVKAAIDAHEIRLDYQPKIDLASGAVVGAEAIMRWRYDGAVVPPAQYLPALTDEVLWDLTIYCYRRLLRDMVDYAVQLPIATKVPVSCLVQTGFFEFVQRETHLWGIEPSQITFEVSELCEVLEQSEAADRLRELKALGCRLSIADFDAAFTNEQRLADFCFDEVKVDAALAQQIGDPDMRAFAERIGSCGIDLVAEGIEDATTLELMRDWRCTSGQGFYLGAPLQIPRLVEITET